jgi:hypothetical protein
VCLTAPKRSSNRDGFLQPTDIFLPFFLLLLLNNIKIHSKEKKMGSSRKKKSLFFIVYLYECVYCTVVFIRRINHPLIFFFLHPPTILKRYFALKCSYKEKYTVAMFEREKKNTKRFFFLVFTGKVSLISRGIWLEEKNNKQTKRSG